MVADIGANPFKYGNQGILLNSDGLKQWLFGPIDGTAAQQRADRNAGMTGMRGTFIKFGIFGVIMVLLTGFLFVTFAEVRTGSINDYSAVFNDASRLETGDTVRVAGIRVGTVQDVSLQDDRNVLVKFDAEQDIVLTNGTKAQIRYLNLVGDRYLELVDAPGSTKILPAGARYPSTAPRPRSTSTCCSAG